MALQIVPHDGFGSKKAWKYRNLSKKVLNGWIFLQASTGPIEKDKWHKAGWVFSTAFTVVDTFPLLPPATGFNGSL